MSSRRHEPIASTSRAEVYGSWAIHASTVHSESFLDSARRKVVSGQSSRALPADGTHRSSSRSHRTEAYPATFSGAAVPSSHHPVGYGPVEYNINGLPGGSRSDAVPPITSARSGSYSGQSTRPQTTKLQQQDPYDARLRSHQRSATVPGSQTQVRASDIQDHSSAARQYYTAKGTYTMAIPQTGQTLPGVSQSQPSKKHRQKEADGEKENSTDKRRESHQRVPEAGLAVDPYRSKPKVREDSYDGDARKVVDKTHRRDPSVVKEYKSSSRPVLSSREYLEPRNTDTETSDVDLNTKKIRPSGHRRYRTEEGTSATSTSRQRQDNFLLSGLSSQSRQIQDQSTAVHTQSTSRPPPALPPDHEMTNLKNAPENPVPPTPYVMPVYLPEGRSKPHKSHHERVKLASANNPGSGSDTEGPGRREHRQVSSEQAGSSRRHLAENFVVVPETVKSSSRYEYGERQDKPMHTQIPGKPVQEARPLVAQLSDAIGSKNQYPTASRHKVEIPLVTPAFSQTRLPTEGHPEGSSTAQFVTIRAGQGPSDPQVPQLLSKNRGNTYPEGSSASARPRLPPKDRSQTADPLAQSREPQAPSYPQQTAIERALPISSSSPARPSEQAVVPTDKIAHVPPMEYMAMPPVGPLTAPYNGSKTAHLQEKTQKNSLPPVAAGAGILSSNFPPSVSSLQSAGTVPVATQPLFLSNLTMSPTIDEPFQSQSQFQPQSLKVPVPSAIGVPTVSVPTELPAATLSLPQPSRVGSLPHHPTDPLHSQVNQGAVHSLSNPQVSSYSPKNILTSAAPSTGGADLLSSGALAQAAGSGGKTAGDSPRRSSQRNSPSHVYGRRNSLLGQSPKLGADVQRETQTLGRSPRPSPTMKNNDRNIQGPQDIPITAASASYNAPPATNMHPAFLGTTRSDPSSNSTKPPGKAPIADVHLSTPPLYSALPATASSDSVHRVSKRKSNSSDIRARALQQSTRDLPQDGHSSPSLKGKLTEKSSQRQSTLNSHTVSGPAVPLHPSASKDLLPSAQPSSGQVSTPDQARPNASGHYISSQPQHQQYGSTTTSFTPHAVQPSNGDVKQLTRKPSTQSIYRGQPSSITISNPQVPPNVYPLSASNFNHQAVNIVLPPHELGLTPQVAGYGQSVPRPPSRAQHSDVRSRSGTHVTQSKVEEVVRPSSRAAMSSQTSLHHTNLQSTVPSSMSASSGHRDTKKIVPLFETFQAGSTPYDSSTTNHATRPDSKVQNSSRQSSAVETGSRSRATAAPPVVASSQNRDVPQTWYLSSSRQSLQTVPSTNVSSAVHSPSPQPAVTGSNVYQAVHGRSVNSSEPSLPHGRPPSAGGSTRGVPLGRSVSNDTAVKTPSSMTPSVLKPLTSTPPSPKPSHESGKRGSGLLNMFRGRSSSTKENELRGPPEPTKARPSNHPRLETKSHQPSLSKVKLEAPQPSQGKTPALLTVPTSERRGPNATTKVFSPFRFMSTSRRHRTVSTASIDAQDGTANNTVIGSPTISAISQNPDCQLPPIRDPIVAARDWTDMQEVETLNRGSGRRRRRPGVTFDVGEEGPSRNGRVAPPHPPSA